MTDNKTAQEWERYAKEQRALIHRGKYYYEIEYALDNYTHAIRMQLLAERNLIPINETNKEDGE